MKYGYIRVSSKDQHIARQMSAMKEKGLTDCQIYIDTASGKDFNRTSYKQMLKNLQSGDEIIIKSIDRLGRNYEEIIEQWNILVKDKK